MKKDLKKSDKKIKEDKKFSKKTSILVEEDERKVAKEAKSQKIVKKEVSESRASARFLKISPKKVRLVINEIRSLKVEEALDKLKLINKRAVPLIAKLLNSAIANAEHNFKLKKEDLYIKQIVANQGPTLHRWKPAAFGRATPIRKRTTHLEVVLGVKQEKPLSTKEVKKPASTPKRGEQKSEKKEETKKVVKLKKAEVKKDKKIKKEKEEEGIL